MDIHNYNYHYMTDDLLYTFNNYFIEYKEKNCDYIVFDSLLKIVKNFGYIPEQFELYDLKGEVGNKIDKIYFFVIMGRIIRKMKQKETIDELKECFKTIDFDKNGTIERDELHKIIKKYIKNPPSYDHIVELFNGIDLNNDNHITFDEFTKYLHDF